MGKILGLDVGEKRIGAAISDEIGIIAIPLGAVEAEEGLEQILSLIKENEIETLVLGFPREMDGEPSMKRAFIEDFVKMLKDVLPSDVKIEFEDETGTSILAKERLKKRKVNFRINKELVDIEAAVIILQAYLDGKGERR